MRINTGTMPNVGLLICCLIFCPHGFGYIIYVITMFCWAIHVTKLYKQYITVSNLFMFRSLHPEYDRETTWRYVEIRLSFTVIDRDEEWVVIFRGIQLSYHNFLRCFNVSIIPFIWLSQDYSSISGRQLSETRARVWLSFTSRGEYGPIK